MLAPEVITQSFVVSPTDFSYAVIKWLEIIIDERDLALDGFGSMPVLLHEGILGRWSGGRASDCYMYW